MAGVTSKYYDWGGEQLHPGLIKHQDVSPKDSPRKTGMVSHALMANTWRIWMSRPSPIGGLLLQLIRVNIQYTKMFIASLPA